ncbi:3',5'-bisphosphate nucleotidase [Exophiala viscosa]|uniref:3',5'-bisphosphate nucleotidase n=1 Tax=Exophiala viscosa TaxID=2486360 RepID=UPI0021A06B2E|nr:3',5'-bisphosphate nucleotidase [Exophiala viscosa]
MEVAASGWEDEYRIALLAVQRAVILTKTVLSNVDKGALTKEDNSPVTIADFGAQALLIDAVHRNFPDDGFVGEESADALRKDAQLCERVWELVRTTCLDDDEGNLILGNLETKKEMVDAIDRGSRSDGRSKGRVWVLDPIDGTQAFVNGGQYAVALAMVEDGVQRVGVLGCPNLGLDQVDRGEVGDSTYQKDGTGVMLSAVRGHGSYIRPLSQGKLLPARKIEQPARTGPVLKFVDSSKSRTTDLQRHRRVAANLGSTWPGSEVLSLQMRYVAITTGNCDAMIRIPRDETYREPVWDHAGGALILEEAGGRVTDLNGQQVDFGQGRRLQNNHGLVAALKDAHTTVLAAVQGNSQQGGE